MSAEEDLDEFLKNTKEEVINKITKSPDYQPKDRWSYRMAKREFHMEKKGYRKEKNFDMIMNIRPEDRLKAYMNSNLKDTRNLAIKLIFLGFMAWLAPATIPQLIKNLFT